MWKKFPNKQNFFRPITEDRKCFPDIETKRPEIAVYPSISRSESRNFIYITNFDEREYQFQISLSSVKQNSLIIIPTGLGKTFIAAMIIINFYRWFPTGKIIFMATSRPLVKQQMFALRKMDIIPQKDIVEITGGVLQSARNQYWESARLFFATPQTIQKDIERGVCPISRIVLVIVDEAHHARGNHSYCRIIQKIAEVTKFFRVIALTATPGSSFEDIQQVIYNLMISNIQVRTYKDCSKYTHSKDIQYIVVPNAHGVEELSARLNSILQEYLRILLQESLVSTMDPTRTSKGVIAQLIKRSRDLSSSANCAIIQSIKLLNLREKLENYSIPVFTRELEEMLLKRDNKITNDETVTTTYEQLHHLLNAARKNSQEDPKMKKLSEVVINFFDSSSAASKVIVFCSYRDIVHEIVNFLKKAAPSIKAVEFIGQASSDKSHGQNQSKQLRVMEAFKKGIYNVLVSTSIGEEGLDIGEVDLIVFYDIQKSPTRTIQRMGRTGRHQDGSVVILLSEASKHLANKAENASDSTANLIAKRMNDFVFYTDCPPMNDNKLTIHRKQYDVREMEEYDLKTKKEKDTKRATLLTSELDELYEHHGETLKYQSLHLNKYPDYQAGAVFFTPIGTSSESKILQNIIDSILSSSVVNSLAPDTSLIVSPFALDSSQVSYERPEYLNQSPHFQSTPQSSQTPKRMGISEFLGIDLSSDSSDSDSSTNSFQTKLNQLKNKNKSEELKSLNENANEIRNNELVKIMNEEKKLRSDSSESDDVVLNSSEKTKSQKHKSDLPEMLNDIGSSEESDQGRIEILNQNSTENKSQKLTVIQKSKPSDSDNQVNHSLNSIERKSLFLNSDSSDSFDNQVNHSLNSLKQKSSFLNSKSSDFDNQPNYSLNSSERKSSFLNSKSSDSMNRNSKEKKSSFLNSDSSDSFDNQVNHSLNSIEKHSSFLNSDSGDSFDARKQVEISQKMPGDSINLSTVDQVNDIITSSYHSLKNKNSSDESSDDSVIIISDTRSNHSSQINNFSNNSNLQIDNSNLQRPINLSIKSINNDSSDDNFEFKSESSSFVSASSEIIVSESDHDVENNTNSDNLLERKRQEIQTLLNETNVSDSDSDSDHFFSTKTLLNRGLTQENLRSNNSIAIKPIITTPIARLDSPRFKGFTPNKQSKPRFFSSSDSGDFDSSD